MLDTPWMRTCIFVLTIHARVDSTFPETERYGASFSYNVPVPLGDYEVILHMSEVFFKEKGKRLFDVTMEGVKVFTNVDIFQLGGGQDLKAITLVTPQTVSDGVLSMLFTDSVPKANQPKISGIEIKRLAPHLAHAVAGGPYFSTDSDGDGFEAVAVDAYQSHTYVSHWFLHPPAPMNSGLVD